ncbi:MAG: hypothetical protein C0507_10305 [Cyanobacteria bacterium PR.3.49]|nr:hypothetical protein [Cyanobacteria bacterium PR.3.49]
MSGKFDEVAEKIRDAVYANEETAKNLYKDASKSMEENGIDSREERAALSKKLEEMGILGEVIFDNLSDDLGTGGYGNPSRYRKDAIDKLSESEDLDPLSQLAAQAAASKMDDNEALTKNRLKKIEHSRIASELLKMYPTEGDWKKIAGSDGNLTETELKKAIDKESDAKDRETLERLLKHFYDFKTWQTVDFEDVQAEVNGAIAFDYADDDSGKPGEEDAHEEEEKSESEKETDEAEIAEMSEKELKELLEDEDSSIEGKLAAVKELGDRGISKITITDSDGRKVTCSIVVEPVAEGSDRNYVHLFAIDESGDEKVILRAIEKEGQYEKQRDKNGNNVGYVGTWWANNHPDSAIAA